MTDDDVLRLIKDQRLIKVQRLFDGSHAVAYNKSSFEDLYKNWLYQSEPGSNVWVFYRSNVFVNEVGDKFYWDNLGRHPVDETYVHSLFDGCFLRNFPWDLYDRYNMELITNPTAYNWTSKSSLGEVMYRFSDEDIGYGHIIVRPGGLFARNVRYHRSWLQEALLQILPTLTNNKPLDPLVQFLINEMELVSGDVAFEH